jgi:hypothetical protein
MRMIKQQERMMGERRMIVRERQVMVRVVRDSADSSQDYYLTLERAQELFEQRKLIQINVYGGKWSYATRNPSENPR